MTKSLKTVVMPDGSTTQILSSKPFTHAVVFYNAFYDGWTVKRWEESWPEALKTHDKMKMKKLIELGMEDYDSFPPSEVDKATEKFNDTCEILELNIHRPSDFP